MNEYVRKWWEEGLKIGYENTSHGLEKSRIMIINGLSILVLVVCLTHTVIFVYIGASHKWQALYSVPLYLVIFWLNRKHYYKVSSLLFTYGTYLLIAFWSFENRRTGTDYGLIALATSVALIESSKVRAYLFFVLCFITYLIYKAYDFNQVFIPDETLNYDLIQNSILFSCGGIIFIQMIIFRNLTEHFADEANNKYDQLKRALEIKKQTEEKLKTSNKDLQQLREQLEWIVKQKTTELQTYLDAINVNIYSSITDLNGNFVKVNEPLMKYSGYASEELIGKNIRFLDAGYNHEAFYQEIETVVADGKTWRGEMKLMNKNGSVYWTDQVIIPIKGRANKVSYFLTLALPITERKLHEEAREKTIQVLESIAFKTSHKVRGPLARIQGLVSLVKNNLVKEDEIGMVAQGLHDCSMELNHATSDLVKFVNEHQTDISFKDEALVY